MKSCYYLTTFVVCLSYFPNWAVDFMFLRVLGTFTASGKHPVRIWEAEAECKHARAEAVAVMRNYWAEGGENCFKGRGG